MENFPIYFSLGEAVAALGLIFAVYQLKRPAWSIVLSIKGKTYWVWIFSGLGLLCVLIATIITQISSPLLLEILGYIFFILAPITLLVLAENKRNLFTKNNAEKFYRIILNNIARAEPETLKSCVNVIGANLDKIIEVISKSPIERRNDNDNEKKPEFADYARSILNVILTEPEVVSYIATSRLDFLSHLLQEMKEKHLNNYRHRIGLMISCLASELFSNQKSYLYTQLKYGGFGLYKPLFESLFYDQEFLNQFDPLQEWHGQLGEERFDVYIEALSHALRGYWFDDDKGRYSIFERAFDQLTDAANSVAIDVSRLSRENFWSNPLVNGLRETENFLGSDFPKIYKEALEKKKVKEWDLEVKVEGKYKFPASATAAYAKVVFEFLCALSIAEKQSEELRILAYEATSAIFGFRKNGFEKITERFLELLWEKIQENVHQRVYPAVLRVYLSLMIPSRSSTDEGKKLIKLLYDELKPLILSGEKMVNGELMENVLFPSSIILDKGSGEFKFRQIDGSLKVIEQINVSRNLVKK